MGAVANRSLRIVETIVLDAERNTTIGAAEENNGHIVIRLLLPSSQIRNVIGRFGNVIERIRVGSGSPFAFYRLRKRPDARNETTRFYK